MKPKISIIIPVYNCDQFLKKCIDSLLNQTLPDIELIFINDGSTDNSGDILNQYREKDNRVVVINKENSGASICRNLGIKIAKGDYIGFVDADDFVSKTMYENLLSAIDMYDADLCIGGYSVYFSNNKIIEENPITQGIYDEKGIINQIVLNMIESSSDIGHKIPGFIWCNLYKTKIIKENSIYFKKELKISEDLLFNLEYLLCCEKVCVIEENNYYYRYNTFSQTVNYNSNLIQNIESLYQYLDEFLFKNNLFPQAEERYSRLVINNISYLLLNECNLNNNSNFFYKMNNIAKICSNYRVKHAFKNLNNLTKRNYIILIILKLKLYIFFYAYYSFVNFKRWRICHV